MNNNVRHQERVLEQKKLVADKEHKLEQTYKDLQKIHNDYAKSIEEQKNSIFKEKRTLEILQYQQKLLENFKQLEEQLQ